MDNKDLFKILKKCINERCDEQCFMYCENRNCQYKLLDIIMNKLSILPDDYRDWLEYQSKESK